MLKAKYIIAKNNDGEEIGFLLPHTESHNPYGYRLRFVIISAGECVFDQGEFNCYGASKSLNVKSRPGTDAEILNKLFR